MFEILKTSEGKINSIIFLIGFIAVLIGILAQQYLGELWSTVVVSVGASVMASAVVSYITSIYILKRKRQQEITEIWGLSTITETRAEMNLLMQKHFESFSEKLDVIGYGLKSFRESEQSKLLKDKLRNGAVIRIITVDPKISELNIRDNDENKLSGSTADSIKKLAEWVSEIQQETNGNITLKYCRTLPTEMYFRVDSKLYVGPYQFKRESQKTITVEFNENSKGFNYYETYFETLWNEKNFCTETD